MNFMIVHTEFKKNKQNKVRANCSKCNAYVVTAVLSANSKHSKKSDGNLLEALDYVSQIYNTMCVSNTNIEHGLCIVIKEFKPFSLLPFLPIKQVNWDSKN